MQRGHVTAVLGPTNTGKTHYAIERMLAHRTGVIGLPLRLLAREVYDRCVALRGPSVVALVTGEERIVPPRARYWVCTTEAMPTEIGADFLAVDEIQLCADPERGHVFTDRLLHARGLHETLFLGADTMRNVIAAEVPGLQVMRRERFSTLAYAGSKKISRMPPRSAIVGFSVENVYAMAELIRRTKGGCAVVMGALSPRTRNAQVDLYQNGDVDYLVATDAIGMGLNLDVRHVAFSGLRKFDGRRMRQLAPNELAQIAGRAGRYKTDGTFGVTGEAPPLEDHVIEAIEAHRFTPVQRLQWRNARLDFGSLDRLIASLEAPPPESDAANGRLVRAREADDLSALKTVAELREIRERAVHPKDVQLLWDVCRIPDFRGISHAEHAGLVERLFGFLHEYGRVPDDWMAEQVRRIDRTEGEIDALSKRLAYIRTWTYVAQRPGWLDDESHWREATRAVEDRLSDALHGALTQRFVDRRTSVLMRRLKQKESLVAEVTETGEVSVEGQYAGRLEGFRFTLDKKASGDEAKTLRQAAAAALRPQFHLKADRFYNAPDTEIEFTEQGGLMWGDQAVGKLVKGADALKPQIAAFVDGEAGADVADKVARRLQHFVDRKLATLFEPLLALRDDEALEGMARGFAFQLVEGFGILPRQGQVAADVKALDQTARGALRKHGVRFGQFTVFLPALLKPAPTRLRLVLWSLWEGIDEFPESPPPGLVTIPVPQGVPQGYLALSGYRAAGARAIRIDMLERLADQIRAQDTRSGFEATPDMLSITGMTLEQFADLMQGLGYRAEKGERPKARAADPAATGARGSGAEGARDAAVSTSAGESLTTATGDGAVAAADPTSATPVQTGDAVDAEAVVEPSPLDAASLVQADPAGVSASDTPEIPPGPSETPPPPGPEVPPTPDPIPEAPPEAPPGPAAPEVPDAPDVPETSDPSARAGMPHEAGQTGLPGPAEAEVAARAQAEADLQDAGAGSDGADAEAPARAAGESAEVEVFYTFTWAPKRQGGGSRRGRDQQGKGGRPPKPAGGERPRAERGPKGAKGDKGRGKPQGAKNYEARPPKREKAIDPDNPFAAALMGLKDKS
ncbi:MAG: ATP-dependent RNA helicase SUV3 [Rhodobacteraceae bacterium HLUCCA09]|nr:MAG: ATP-dependent RNA helicase SUV3 [Rhodobacteraceae bacterium HLUCCA09]